MAETIVEDISDIEIVAQTVRYARAAPPRRKAKTILAFLKRDYPHLEERRILACMKQAADMLLKQHN